MHRPKAIAANEPLRSEAQRAGTKNALRVAVYLVGLILLASGMVIQTSSGLGVAALTCFATAAALVCKVSLGMMVFLTYVIYVGVQAWITRKNFKPKMLLELLFSMFMGFFVDLLEQLLRLNPETMAERVLIMLMGLVVTAVGVSLVVGMDIVPNAPDGLVQAIAQRTGRKFGSIKVAFDTSHVAASLALSLTCLGSLAGFGLTTIVSALFLGQVINLVNKVLYAPLHAMVFGYESEGER